MKNVSLVGLKIKTAWVDEGDRHVHAEFEGGKRIMLFSGDGMKPGELIGRTLHEAWSLKFRRDMAVCGG